MSICQVNQEDSEGSSSNNQMQTGPIEEDSLYLNEIASPTDFSNKKKLSTPLPSKNLSW